MNSDFRALRATLFLVCIANAAFAYITLLSLALFRKLYSIPALDNVHQYLAMGRGSLHLAFAVGAVLALMKPIKYAGIITLLILSHFSLFLVDVIVVARAQMPFKTLLPEMVYFLIISAALVRFFPSKPKEEAEEEQPPEGISLAEKEGAEEEATKAESDESETEGSVPADF